MHAINELIINSSKVKEFFEVGNSSGKNSKKMLKLDRIQFKITFRRSREK